MQRSPILGVPLYVCVTLCRRTTKFDAVTHIGSGLVFTSITVSGQIVGERGERRSPSVFGGGTPFP